MNRGHKKNICSILVVIFFTSILHAQAASNSLSKEILKRQGFEEFIGNNNIPFPAITKNAFSDACQFVNTSFNTNVCNAEEIANFISEPQGIILAPSENDKSRDFDLLLMVDGPGLFGYLDANSSHLQQIDDFHVALIGNQTVADMYSSRLTKIVSNFEGDFWVIDQAGNKILRIRHEWTQGKHVFSTLGTYQLETGKIVDLYMTTMKTNDHKDDRLYLLINDPAHFQVIDPYFSGDVSESQCPKKYSDDPLNGTMVTPKAIAGAYNNEPGAANQDPRIIYIIDRGNRLSVLKDRGLDLLPINTVWLYAEKNSRFQSIKTNVDGDLYIADRGMSRILKLNNEFDLIYSIGSYGLNSSPGDVRFNEIRDIATRGAEFYVTDRYTPTTGVQRFKNASMILKSDLFDMGPQGYSPVLAAAGIKPYPKIKFTISEAATVTFRIYSESGNELLWSQSQGYLTSGTHTLPITWNGMDSSSVLRSGRFKFVILTKKYFPDFDDSEAKTFIVDTKPPNFVKTAQIRYESNFSIRKPFFISIPFDELIAHAQLNIYNSAGLLIDSVMYNASSGNYSDRAEFTWNVSPTLGSCEKIDVAVIAEDCAGNRSSLIQITKTEVPELELTNKTGGITNVVFNISKPIISPIAADPANRLTQIGIPSFSSVCGLIMSYRISIYDTPFFEREPVYVNEGYTGKSIAFDWNGTNSNGTRLADGIYYVLFELSNAAGYSVSSKDLGFANNAVTIRTAIPRLLLTGNSSNTTFSHNGNMHLLVTGNNKVAITVTCSKQPVQNGRMIFEYSTVTKENTQINYRDSILLPSQTVSAVLPITNNVSGGFYTFSAYYIDDLLNGKDSASCTTIQQNGMQISSIYIDRNNPQLLVDVEKAVINKGENLVLWLLNNTYNSYGNSETGLYTYSYDLFLVPPTNTPIKLRENAPFPSSVNRLKEAIDSNAFTNNGTYCIKTVLKDNYGNISDTATAFVYVNERPIAVGVNINGISISGKTYITGTLGDPDISTAGEENRFDHYSLYFKEGANQIPSANFDPASLTANGWKTSTGSQTDERLFVPFFRQSVADTTFPFSNTSIVQTNMLGFATIGYINALPLSVGPYTLLAVTYAKSGDLPAIATCNFNVNSPNDTPSLQITRLTTTQKTSGIEIRYSVSARADVHIVAVKKNGDSFSSMINAFHFTSIKANEEQIFVWDKKDFTGNYAENGIYQVLVSAEQSAGNASDWAVSDTLMISTDFTVTDAKVAPLSITVPPTPGVLPPENITTVSFLANKKCGATLDIYFQDILYKRIGPVLFDKSGAASQKTISWDGTSDTSLPFNQEVPYKLHLNVNAIDDTTKQFSDTSLQVYRLTPQMASGQSGIPGLSLAINNIDLQYDTTADQATTGTSDYYWLTRLNGTRRSTADENVSARLLIQGKQNVEVWKSDSQSGGFEIGIEKRFHSLMMYVTYDLLCISNLGTSTVRDTVLTWPVVGQISHFPYAPKEWIYRTSHFIRPPVVQNIRYSSLEGTMNDLAGYIRHVKDSTWIDPRHDSIAYVNIYFELDTTKFQRTITNTLSSGHGGEWVDHYHPLLKAENITVDFPAVFYSGSAEFGYSFSIYKIPENGGISLQGFDWSIWGHPPTPINIPGILENQIIKRAGVKVIKNPWPFFDDLDSVDADDTTYLKNLVGDTTFVVIPHISSLPGHYITVNATCEATQMRHLNWPFPATGVPALMDTDGTPYNQIAFKTINNVDPRPAWGGNGTFSNITGVFRAPAAQVTTDNKYIKDVTFVLPGDANYPYTKNIETDLFNPSDYSSYQLNSVNYSRDTTHDSLAGGGSLAIIGNQIIVNRTEQQVPRLTWSSAQDSLISPIFNGFFGNRQQFSNNSLELSSSIDVKDGYKQLTDIKTGTGSLSNSQTFKLSFWRDSQGVMINNPAVQLSTLNDIPAGYEAYPGNISGVNLSYVNGSKNTALLIDTINFNDARFNIKHAPNAASRRFIEVSGVSEFNGSAWDNYTLNYYDVNAGVWNRFGTIKNTPDALIPIKADTTKRILGFWDITHCNGPQILKLEVNKDSRSQSIVQQINIGTPITATNKDVYSTYSKVQLTFPSGSSYRGIVTVTQINPSEIDSVDQQVIPVGPIVDVQPEGLLFGAYNPQLTFSFTVEDIQAMGISLDKLGEINIFYIDKSTGQLTAVETGISRYIHRKNGSTDTVSEGVSNAPLTDGDIYSLGAAIAHTSLYGAFARSRVPSLTFSGLPIVVNKPVVAKIEGGAPPNTMLNIIVNTAPVIDSTGLITAVQSDGSGHWSITSLKLIGEGKNYIFASAMIDSQQIIIQNAVIFDSTAPVVHISDSVFYISNAVDTVFNLPVTSNEAGVVIVEGLESNDGDRREYVLEYKQPNYFSTDIPILASKFTENRNIISIKAIDIAGNVSAPIYTTIIRDDDPPVILNAIAKNIGIGSLRLQATIVDNELLSSVEYLVIANGKELDETRQNISLNAASYNLSADIIVPSSYTGTTLLIKLIAVDRAGNRATTQIPTVPAEEENYNAWLYSKDILLDNLSISDSLKSFPLLIRLNESNFDFSTAQPDGEDIRFSDTLGNKLFYEIESWDSVLKTAEIWVNIPLILRNEKTKVVRMYWGNPNVLNHQNSMMVWFDRHQAVYHFGKKQGISNNVPDTITDATIYNNYALNHNSTITNGLIGTSQNFDGISSFIDCGKIKGIQEANQLTVSMWVKRDTNSSEEMLAAMHDGDLNGWTVGINNQDQCTFRTGDSSILSTLQKVDTISRWYYLCFVHDGKTMKIYIDGDSVAAMSSLFSQPSIETALYLGIWMGKKYFKGNLDEVRISDVARPSDWIRLSYAVEKEEQQRTQIPPLSPRDITISTSDSVRYFVKLSWQIPKTGIDTIEIQRRELGQSDWVTIVLLDRTQTNYDDIGTECGKNYEYRLRYLFGQTASDWSSIFTFTTPRCYDNSELITINAMVLDDKGIPVTSDSSQITIKVYADPFSADALFTESSRIGVRNGYLSFVLGKKKDFLPVLNSNDLLYYKFNVDGVGKLPRKPLTAFGITALKNDYHLKGSGSPIGTVNAAVGSLYLDIDSKRSYIKYGEAIDNWKAIE